VYTAWGEEEEGEEEIGDGDWRWRGRWRLVWLIRSLWRERGWRLKREREREKREREKRERAIIIDPPGWLVGGSLAVVTECGRVYECRM